MRKTNKRLKILLKASLTIISLWFLWRSLDPIAFKKVLSNMSISALLLMLTMYIFSKAIAALRLKVLIDPRCPMSTFDHISLCFRAMLYSFILPGGISADIYKVHELNRVFSVSRAPLAKSMLIDRLSGLLALSTMTGSLLVFHFLSSYSFIGLIVLLVFLVFASSKLIDRRLTQAYLLSFLVQGLQASAIVVLCFTLQLPEKVTYVTISLLSAIVAMLPITLGGIGGRELASTYLTEFLGGQPEYAVLGAMCMSLISVLSSLTALPWHILKAIENNKRVRALVKS